MPVDFNTILSDFVYAVKHRLSQFLEISEEIREVKASGLNPIKCFQSIKVKNTGKYLYSKSSKKSCTLQIEIRACLKTLLPKSQLYKS